MSNVDAGPQPTLDTIEIVDSPPQLQTLNDSNLEDFDDSITDDATVAVSIKWKSNKIECIQLNKVKTMRFLLSISFVSTVICITQLINMHFELICISARTVAEDFSKIC